MRILLVEHDRALKAALTSILKRRNYTVDLAEDGQTGLDLATTVEYDLILLNATLPKLDGINACRQLRSRGYRQPIILLSADSSDAVAIAGFDAGADDYMIEPYVPEVLLARMRTLLRRTRAKSNATNISWGELSLDPDSGRVAFAQTPISLTATEYNLLELFLRHPERIFSRSAIINKLWGFDEAPTDRAINTYIKDIRKKLKAVGLAEEVIETVYGMGYRLKASPQAVASNTEDSRILEELRQQCQGLFAERVRTIEKFKQELELGQINPGSRLTSRQEAHKLAGSLATYGYLDGSKFALSIEHLLAGDRSLSVEDIDRLGKLVSGLKHDLSKENVKTPAFPSYKVLAVATDRLKAEADNWGLLLKSVPNAIAARSCLALSLPDAVLLDATAPGSLELMQEIAQKWSHLPVILLGEKDSLTDRLAVSHWGARQFLPKNASADRIYQAIARVISSSKKEQGRVLIVDDDPQALAFLSGILTPWGLEVITLSEPQQFWQVLTDTSPHLLLLDLQMPQVSGLDLCQVVRQDSEWGDLPILVVTASTDPKSLQQAFALGADDFITKPVLGPDLVARVLSRIERKQCKRKV